MTLTLYELVDEAHQEFVGGAAVTDAIRTTITRHANELCADGCQLVLDILPDEAKKPTDLWFATFPMPYVIANLEPYISTALLNMPDVAAEIVRRSKTHTDRDRFKFRPLN